MPGGDGTGPTGQGPMTGRGRRAAGQMGVSGQGGMGRGQQTGGRGRGRGGHGRRNMFRQTGLTGWQRATEQPPEAAVETPVPTAELASEDKPATADLSVEMLQRRAAQLAAQLEDIQTQIQQRQGPPRKT